MMNDRRLQILEDVSTNEIITVAQLATKHSVSQVTIRNDLRELHKAGLIQRVHGGAASKSDERIDNRLNSNYEIKLRIAERAAQMVEAGETVLIESGSTNALLAKKLAETRDVTIVTNSYFIAKFVRDEPRARVVLLGGDYQADAEVCVGPLTRQTLQFFFVDKLFIGSDGFSDEGFTCNDMQRAEIAAEMARRAKKAIVLTDSSKFFTRGVATQLHTNEVSMVITDDGIPQDAQAILEQSQVEVITVQRQIKPIRVS